MFERFTDQARRVVVHAQEEVRALGHDSIGTEHLLLGLVREGKGVGAHALLALGISREAVLDRIEGAVEHGDQALSGHIPFSQRAKDTLVLSLQESRALGHRYIGTEHILLALLAPGEGTAAQVLSGLGATPEAVRAQVTRLLDEHQRRADRPAD